MRTVPPEERFLFQGRSSPWPECGAEMFHVKRRRRGLQPRLDRELRSPRRVGESRESRQAGGNEGGGIEVSLDEGSGPMDPFRSLELRKKIRDSCGRLVE